MDLSLLSAILVDNKMSRNLFSYIVRYDSGFAPNPFYKYCTLATCKLGIRSRAQVNDWIVGTGSNARKVRRGGYLVYAMRVTEVLSTEEYWVDSRFQNKKPNLYHNWVTASGDNIYELISPGRWHQINSYHSNADGSPAENHIRRDTSVKRVLVSNEFVYFGGEGPRLPDQFCHGEKFAIICLYRNYRRISQGAIVSTFENWFRSLDSTGFQGKPWDWIARRV